MPCRRCSVLTALLLAPSLVLSARQSTDNSSSSKDRQKTEQHVKASRSAPASSDATAYRNPEFAFICKIPYGWVDRTKEMQDDSADPSKSRLLLAVFERPPEVTGDTVNSAVIITAESVSSYPGLKTAADYLGPLTELTASKGFKPVAEPYEFPVGTTRLVRADFTKDLGKLTMRQSSLLLLRKGYVLSFTFIAGSEDELDELIEKLSFAPARPR